MRGAVSRRFSPMSANTLLIGGNSGIGLETVRKLQAAGHTLHAASRSSDQLEALGVSCQSFTAESDCDLQLPDQLDNLIYFPGTITLKPFHRLNLSDFQHELNVNLMGAIKVMQAALPALKKSPSASVVFFSTVAVQTGMPFHTSIAAAKGALEGFARSLAAELAPKIRVNLIAPSLTDTDLAANLLKTDEQRAAAAKRHPLNQIGDPVDVASLVDFLTSPASQFMTGQTFRPDGGLSSLKLFS